jgi:hypothetical protein
MGAIGTEKICSNWRSARDECECYPSARSCLRGGCVDRTSLSRQLSCDTSQLSEAYRRLVAETSAKGDHFAQRTFTFAFPT